MATIVSEKSVVAPANYGIVLFHRVLNMLLLILNLFLVIRLILKATGANPNSGFVHFIYSAAAPLIYPFTGIFPNQAADVNHGIFEWATFVAIVIYTLAVIVIKLIMDAFVKPKNRTVVKENL